MKRIILAGYIGFGNCGDEAMLAGAIRWIRAHEPDSEICVLSHHPEETAAAHGVRSLPALPFGRLLPVRTILRPARWKTLAALRRTDLVVWIAGSGIFSDARGCTIREFWPLFSLLRRLARRFIFLSASVGPIEFPESADFIRRIADDADAFGVRDPDSCATLRAIVGDSPKIVPMADMALELAASSAPRLEALWREEGLNPKARHLACCPIYFFQTAQQFAQAEAYQNQFIGAMAAALDELAGDGLTPVLVPFQQGYDHEISQRIASRMSVKPILLRGGYAPEEMIGILGRMQAVIGVRFHSLVLAALARTPLVTIIYDDKSRGFVRDAGLEHLSMEYYAWRKEKPPLDQERLVALVRQALREGEAIRRQLGEKVGQMRERNAQGAKIIRN
jgi:polysaccharide pyruvyl transferase WcaK-like protein